MVQISSPLSKFLVPVGSDGDYEAACKLAGYMASLLPGKIRNIAVVHVIAGSYLSSHMENVDTRIRHIVESQSFKKLKQEHIDKDIKPVLDKAKEIITQAAPGVPVDELILEGSPVKEIIGLVKSEEFSTIFLQRRSLDPALAGPLVGSVSSGIIHARVPISIYLPGIRMAREGDFQLRKCLIPVDGSDGSLAALREAAALINGIEENGICEVDLLHVVNVSELPDEFDTSWLKEEGGRILDDSAAYLAERLKKDVAVEKIEAFGEPAKVILEKAEQTGADMIFMGRRGKNALEEILIGSVGRELLSQVIEPTLALVNE